MYVQLVSVEVPQRHNSTVCIEPQGSGIEQGVPLKSLRRERPHSKCQWEPQPSRKQSERGWSDQHGRRVLSGCLSSEVLSEKRQAQFPTTTPPDVSDRGTDGIDDLSHDRAEIRNLTKGFPPECISREMWTFVDMIGQSLGKHI